MASGTAVGNVLVAGRAVGVVVAGAAPHTRTVGNDTRLNSATGVNVWSSCSVTAGNTLVAATLVTVVAAFTSPLAVTVGNVPVAVKSLGVGVADAATLHTPTIHVPDDAVPAQDAAVAMPEVLSSTRCEPPW